MIFEMLIKISYYIKCVKFNKISINYNLDLTIIRIINNYEPCYSELHETWGLETKLPVFIQKTQNKLLFFSPCFLAIK